MLSSLHVDGMFGLPSSILLVSTGNIMFFTRQVGQGNTQHSGLLPMIKRHTVCALCHSRQSLVYPSQTPLCCPISRTVSTPQIRPCSPDWPRWQEGSESLRGQGSSSALVAFFHSTRDVAERGHKEPQLNGLTIPDTPSSPSTIAPGPFKRRITIHLHLSSSWRRRPSPPGPSCHRGQPSPSPTPSPALCPSRPPPLSASCQPTSTTQPSISSSPPTISILPLPREPLPKSSSISPSSRARYRGHKRRVALVVSRSA